MEHNLFVLCNTSQYQNQTIINTTNRNANTNILENTGGYSIDLFSLYQTRADVIWRNSQQDHIYDHCFPNSNQTISLEDILLNPTKSPITL